MLTSDQIGNILAAYKDGVQTQDIAKQHGVSRNRIWNIAKKHGLTTYKRKSVELECPTCHSKFTRTLARTKSAKAQYCTAACYHATRNGAEYNKQHRVSQRQGQRIARAVVEQYYPLQPTQIVHHIDSNTDHNHISNLMVFASQSEHMAYHHGNESVRPIFDGRLTLPHHYYVQAENIGNGRG